MDKNNTYTVQYPVSFFGPEGRVPAVLVEIPGLGELQLADQAFVELSSDKRGLWGEIKKKFTIPWGVLGGTPAESCQPLDEVRVVTHVWELSVSPEVVKAALEGLKEATASGVRRG